MCLAQCEIGLTQEQLILERSRRLASPILIKEDCRIQIYHFSDGSLTRLRLTMILQSPNGSINPVTIPFTTEAAVGAAADLILDPTTYRGHYILSASVILPGGSGANAVFVRVNIAYQYSTLGIDGAAHTILQGTVTYYSGITFPGPSAIREMGDYQGRIRTIVGTDPAAGQEVVETVPNGVRWEPLSMYFRFTADATVTNRTIRFQMDNGVSVFCDAPPQSAVTASNVRDTTVVFGSVGLVASGNTTLIGVPKAVLPAGYRIKTVTTNLQAGDNYGAPVLLVKEWVTQ